MVELFSGNWFTKDWWAFFDALVTLITVSGVFYGIYTNRKSLQKIDVYFIVDGEKRELALDLTRRHITRSEVQGILGNLLKKEHPQYKIDYLSNMKFLNDIFSIQQGKLNYLEIVLDKKECEQFRDNIYKVMENR